jgi:riboflavin biosynthesis pyrimidine reductase
VASDPADLSGGETDKHLIYEGLSRVCADAVMAGAETVREGDIVLSVWHPELVRLRAERGLARHPVQIVATRRGIPIERMLLCNVPEIRVVVLTVRACETSIGKALSSRPWITLVVMDEPRSFPRVPSAPEMGLERISIGGCTRNAAQCEPGYRTPV